MNKLNTSGHRHGPWEIYTSTNESCGKQFFL